ncbi:MAG TPA: DUF3306 domain-containing protein [Burkholderiales bacterium]|nr:DUF3306 domain-containing protein [Burkholderiales bacterium]
MARDGDDFLERWSRLKREARQAEAAPAQAPAARAPGPRDLPPLNQLTPESDFSAFMQTGVGDGMRRAALKKLFSDPRFNVIDPLDIDIDDYSKLEALTPELVEKLEHAKRTLLGPQREAPQADAGAPAAAAAPAPAPAAAAEAAPQEDRKDDGVAG